MSAGQGRDADLMAHALALGAAVQGRTAPNPWVGCVLVARSGATFEGATMPPGGPHAEAVALQRAGPEARGATAYVTLEPCAHHGRTPPCANALVAAGVRRVVVAVVDPDPRVAGAGIARLESAGIEVSVGVLADEVSESLAPYLKHRRSGRPFVVLKLAATLDGSIAALDGTSRWITGEAARRDVHALRAASGAVLVGAGTVRADDPELTVRDLPEAGQPLRIVLGTAPPTARVLPALEWDGELGALLDHLGSIGVLQLLVEGGSHVAASFHRAGLVDRYVVYVAPALLGGNDGVAMMSGPGAPTMAELWRGRFSSVRRVGDDVRIDLEPLEPLWRGTPGDQGRGSVQRDR